MYYVLNGMKQYIINVVFLDMFIMYVKVDGEYFIVFIVEKGFEGLFFGSEEKKMGIKGLFICLVIYENCLVFVENVFG